MTFYLSFYASETDIMACTVCRIIHERCKDNCCFEKYFGPQDEEKFRKIRKNNYSVKFMRATLSDDDISDEDKKGLIENWCVYANAEGKKEKAGSSSSKNEKKESQASKCQACSSNELGCKDNCLFADLFSRRAKEIIVEIINKQGMELLEAELKPKLEKLCRETGDEVQVAQIMLNLKKIDEEVLAAQIMFDFKNKGDRQ